MTSDSAGRAFAAVDLGASSARVIRAEISPAGVRVREVHRVPNRPVRVRGTLHWDVLALWDGVQEGLRAAGRVDGIGVDSWAIDYALIDEDGRLIGNPVHYRDGRTDGVARRVAERLAPTEHYAVTGVQVLPFNTVFQWAAAADDWAMRNAARALLIPDLFGYWLTGRMGTEVTNASTTGLLDVHTRTWSGPVLDAVGLRGDLFPALRHPGELIGAFEGVPVTAVGSHDTASAVVGVPAADEHFAYISCGTWSLVGVELPAPVTTEAARAANFSNELGVDGTVRFLRNVMGLWLLQECMRVWGPSVRLDRLLAEAARLPDRRFLIDVDRPEFLPPGDMPARIRAACEGPAPETPAEITRCVLDSLAMAYARTIREAEELSGRRVEVVHLVGGGAHNELLCRLTARACGLPVEAGPVEAAAYGNALVQARATGALGMIAEGDVSLADLRALIRSGYRPSQYSP
jgi:rhamnulokinase